MLRLLAPTGEVFNASGRCLRAANLTGTNRSRRASLRKEFRASNNSPHVFIGWSEWKMMRN